MNSFDEYTDKQEREPGFSADPDRLHAEAEALQDEASQEMTLDESFDRLDEMLKKLEDSSLPLEEALELYQQGMKLLAKCNEKIDRVEKQVLVVNGEGELSEF